MAASQSSPGPAAGNSAPEGADRLAGAVEEVVQAEAELQVDGLAGAVGQASGAEQQPASLLECVVAALGRGAGVFGPGFLAEGVQDGLQGGGRGRGQVGVQAAGAAEGGGQPQGAVIEPVAGVGVRAGGAAADLLGEAGQAVQVGAAAGGGEQDDVGVGAVLLGELVGPGGDLPRPRGRQGAVGEGGGDRGVLLEAAHRCEAGAGGGPGDPGLPGQPGAGGSLAVQFVAALGGERGQRPGAGRGMDGVGAFQAAQALGLHGCRRGGQVGAGQPAQGGQHHRDRLARRRGLGRVRERPLGHRRGGPGNLTGDGRRAGPRRAGTRRAGPAGRAGTGSAARSGAGGSPAGQSGPASGGSHSAPESGTGPHLLTGIGQGTRDR